MQRITTNDFLEDHEVTVGVEFGSLVVQLADQVAYKVQVWDTAGQENFKSITKVFYRGAHIVFLTFDVTRYETFTNVQRWLTEVQQQLLEEYAVIILVGN